jgi:hypothetical protein
MSRVATLIKEHTKIHHIEFNTRKFSIRDVYRIVTKAKLEPIDIISDTKVHLVIVKDINDRVHMSVVKDGAIKKEVVGFNVFEHVDLLYKDRPIGCKVIFQKDIQYFSQDLKQQHTEYMMSRLALSGESNSFSGGLSSPDDSDDEVYEKNLNY